LLSFARIVDFTWRVSDCEELVGLLAGVINKFLKLNGTIEAQFEFVLV